MQKIIRITNKDAQKIVGLLKCEPQRLRISKCLDIMCDMYGYYDHAVAHKLVERSYLSRPKTARKMTHEEALAWKSQVAFEFVA